MFTSIALVVAGLVLLTGGGEALVRGAVRIAQLWRLSPTVIGLTVVAAGTSLPELVVSLQAALRGSTGLALGNVVGSNIFNISAILGLAALITPLRLSGQTVRLEWPVMLLAAAQLHMLARDGNIDRLEGAFLFAGLIAFVAYLVMLARRQASAEEQAEFEQALSPAPGRSPGAVARSYLLVAVGLALLAGGANLLVRGAVDIAAAAGVSETVIGLTVVAAGTSLPELFASLIASLRGRDDIAVANVIGSNVFNVLGIAGVTALVQPLPVPSALLERDHYWMLGLSLLLLPVMHTGLRVSRIEGALLFGLFLVYTAQLLV